MSDRFNDYREITARRASTADCGQGTHTIQAGDRIGWNPRMKRAQCAACWRRWVAENEAADFDERQYAGGF